MVRGGKDMSRNCNFFVVVWLPHEAVHRTTPGREQGFPTGFSVKARPTRGSSNCLGITDRETLVGGSGRGGKGGGQRETAHPKSWYSWKMLVSWSSWFSSLSHVCINWCGNMTWTQIRQIFFRFTRSYVKVRVYADTDVRGFVWLQNKNIARLPKCTAFLRFLRLTPLWMIWTPVSGFRIILRFTCFAFRAFHIL
jgi:hypothetical protein